MTKEEMDVIADSIIADLPDTVDPRDLGMLRSTTIEMLREGYERRDVVQFLQSGPAGGHRARADAQDSCQTGLNKSLAMQSILW
jgi:hypothetical protein